MTPALVREFVERIDEADAPLEGLRRHLAGVEGEDPQADHGQLCEVIDGLRERLHEIEFENRLAEVFPVFHTAAGSR